MSPEPAVASVGGRSQPIAARPSGAATTVSAPLRTTTAPVSQAAARARASLSSSGPNPAGAGEQARELALVRRHYDGVAAARDEGRERVGLAGKTGQRVGVEHDRPSLARTGQRRRDELPQSRPHTRAGAERNGAPAGVGEKRLEPGEAGKRRDHHGGRMRRVDGDGLRRACERDDPAPARSAALAAMRAAPV